VGGQLLEAHGQGFSDRPGKLAILAVLGQAADQAGLSWVTLD
jgi:hypothetical protein